MYGSLFTNNCNQPSTQRGFSLVELIVIILLLGILSIYAAPRFLDATGSSEYTHRQQLLAALRKLQIQSMQDSRPNFCFQMNFANGSSSPAYGVPTENYLPANASNTCASSIDFTAQAHMRTSTTELSDDNISLTALDGVQSITYIGFDSLGKPLTSQSNCANGCSVTFTGQNTAKICINSQGFVHEREGTCD